MKTLKKKTLIVGDMHLRDSLGYEGHLPHGREKEKQEILDKILEEAKDCNRIVIIGDLLNGRNNPSHVLKTAARLLTKLCVKPTYLLAGNHEKKADGTSALDFLQKLELPNLHVITDKVTVLDGITLAPYFYRQELGAKTNDEATDMLLGQLNDNKSRMLFCHQSISGTEVTKKRRMLHSESNL